MGGAMIDPNDAEMERLLTCVRCSVEGRRSYCFTFAGNTYLRWADGRVLSEVSGPLCDACTDIVRKVLVRAKRVGQ